MKSIKFGYSRYVPWLFAILSIFFVSSRSVSQNSSSSNNIFASSRSIPPPLKMNEVRTNAARHFRNHFSANGNERWYKVDEFYMASFIDGQVITKAYYSSKGVFAFSVRYYTQELLSPDTRFLILKRFDGYKIDVITEISNLQEKFYFIKIKNATNIKTLKVINDNIEVVEDFVNGEGV